MSTKIQVRRGSATDWSSNNPVLSIGEFGYDTTNSLLKIGNGTSTWSLLNSYSIANLQIKPLDSSASFTYFDIFRPDGAYGFNITASNTATQIGSAGSYASIDFLKPITSTGKITGANLRNTSFSAQGVVTNNASGDLFTNVTLPVLYGGTGNAFNDRTLVGRVSAASTVTGVIAGTFQNAIYSSSVPQYLSVDANSIYYFEAYTVLTKGAGASSAWQAGIQYLDSSNNALTPISFYGAFNCWNTSGTVGTTGTGGSANAGISVGTAGTGSGTQHVRGVGYLATNAAGKVSLGFGQSAAATSTAPTASNSYFALYKVSTNGTTSFVGTWGA